MEQEPRQYWRVQLGVRYIWGSSMEAVLRGAWSGKLVGIHGEHPTFYAFTEVRFRTPSPDGGWKETAIGNPFVLINANSLAFITEAP